MITTTEMAEIIVDAIMGAGLIKPEDFYRARDIAEEELRVRLAIGDKISDDFRAAAEIEANTPITAGVNKAQ
jgi:hypothetical protein